MEIDWISVGSSSTTCAARAANRTWLQPPTSRSQECFRMACLMSSGLSTRSYSGLHPNRTTSPNINSASSAASDTTSARRASDGFCVLSRMFPIAAAADPSGRTVPLFESVPGSPTPVVFCGKDRVNRMLSRRAHRDATFAGPQTSCVNMMRPGRYRGVVKHVGVTDQSRCEIAVDPAAVRAQVARMITDPIFNGSRRIRKLLSAIVERTLESPSEGLKEYSLAVDVFDRPASFDP